MINRARALVAMLGVATCLVACDRAEQRRSSTTVVDDKQKCLDKPCPGEEYPKYDPIKERATKVNGQWFVGPAEYGVIGHGMAFLWPSKTPAGAADAEQRAPEFRPSRPGQLSNYPEVAVKIFFRSPQRVILLPAGDDQVSKAAREGRVLSKTMLRQGLERWLVRDPIFRQPAAWYVATELQMPNGKPAILFCGQYPPLSVEACTTGFFWQSDIAVDMRFATKHATDWPEIYQETIRVLQLLRRV